MLFTKLLTMKKVKSLLQQNIHQNKVTLFLDGAKYQIKCLTMM